MISKQLLNLAKSKAKLENIMSKQEIDKSYFLTFCIEQFKQSRGITGAEASEILFLSGIAEYLSENFEVLHTQSRQWLIEEIEERLKEQEQ